MTLNFVETAWLNAAHYNNAMDVYQTHLAAKASKATGDAPKAAAPVQAKSSNLVNKIQETRNNIKEALNKPSTASDTNLEARIESVEAENKALKTELAGKIQEFLALLSLIFSPFRSSWPMVWASFESSAWTSEERVKSWLLENFETRQSSLWFLLALTQRFSALESRLNNLGSGTAPAPAKAAAPAPAEEDDDDDDVDLFGSDDEDDAEAERIKVRTSRDSRTV